jgi:hypothetical protein
MATPQKLMKEICTNNACPIMSDQGRKCCVLAGDYISDQYLVYYYDTGTVQFVSFGYVADNIHVSWPDQIAWEETLVKDNSMRVCVKFTEALAKLAKLEEGRFYKHTSSYYSSFIYTMPIKTVSQAEIENFINLVVDNLLALPKPERVILRMYPNFGLNTCAVTGQRKLVSYVDIAGIVADENIYADKKIELPEAA